MVSVKPSVNHSSLLQTEHAAPVFSRFEACPYCWTAIISSLANRMELGGLA
ncbi:hypothetical protein NQZ68_013754 [Dissostichus eleginoides]|nr:hypothetical protein NQZ68_013754 [Dissostichus eleginoides]